MATLPHNPLLQQDASLPPASWPTCRTPAGGTGMSTNGELYEQDFYTWTQTTAARFVPASGRTSRPPGPAPGQLLSP